MKKKKPVFAKPIPPNQQPYANNPPQPINLPVNYGQNKVINQPPPPKLEKTNSVPFNNFPGQNVNAKPFQQPVMNSPQRFPVPPNNNPIINPSMPDGNINASEFIDPNQQFLGNIAKGDNPNQVPLQNQNQNKFPLFNYNSNAQEPFNTENQMGRQHNMNQPDKNQAFNQNNFNNTNLNNYINDQIPNQFGNPNIMNIGDNRAGYIPPNINSNLPSKPIAQVNAPDYSNFHNNIQQNAIPNNNIPLNINDNRKNFPAFPSFPDVANVDPSNSYQFAQIEIPSNLPNNFPNQYNPNKGIPEKQPFVNKYPGNGINNGQLINLQNEINNPPNDFNNLQNIGELGQAKWPPVNLNQNMNQYLMNKGNLFQDSKTVGLNNNIYPQSRGNAPDPPTHKDIINTVLEKQESLTKHLQNQGLLQVNQDNLNSIQNANNNPNIINANIVPPPLQMAIPPSTNLMIQRMIQDEKSKELEFKEILCHLNDIPEMEPFDINKLNFDFKNLKNNSEEYIKRKQLKEDNTNATQKLNSYYNKNQQGYGNNI